MNIKCSCFVIVSATTAVLVATRIISDRNEKIAVLRCAHTLCMADRPFDRNDLRLDFSGIYLRRASGEKLHLDSGATIANVDEGNPTLLDMAYHEQSEDCDVEDGRLDEIYAQSDAKQADDIQVRQESVRSHVVHRVETHRTTKTREKDSSQGGSFSCFAGFRVKPEMTIYLRKACFRIQDKTAKNRL